MPKQIERCVMALMNDPDFTPEPGRSKEESAWAICTAQYQESEAVAQTLEGRGVEEPIL